MAGRRRAASGFRPSAPQAIGQLPSRRQSVAMIVALLVVASGVAIASFAVKPTKARAFDLFYGTMIINDNTAPVSVDLASGKPTVRLTNASDRVDAARSTDLSAVPLQGGTLLLNTVTGEFNMVDATGFVQKASGGGVRLPAATGSRTSIGVATGDSAYIAQVGGASTDIYLVSQATVAAASTGNQAGTPRAFATLAGQVSADPGSLAAANGGLWVLSGTGLHTVQQLQVPAGSNAGVQLAATAHGTVTGVAALGVATMDADGAGGDAVAVASSHALVVFTPDGKSQQLTIQVPDGTDTILPATNQQGRFDFLYHAPSGWTLVSAPASGGQASVHRLDKLAATTTLAVPAQSSGSLYTMSTDSTGNLWQVDDSAALTPIPGAATYPVVPGEVPVLGDAQVSAQGARVIFNSRANYEAMTVFTDGSHAPVLIDKRTAVNISSSGGVAALAQQHDTTPGKGAPSPGQKNAPKPVEQVNDKINCETSAQTPHVPVLQLLQRGARSVQLQWTYPLLSPQDCLPSTYTVSTQALSGNAPAAPGKVTVQGQNGVNLVGLFPDTSYQIVVTAYINAIGTPSLPLDVATSPEGPAAPTNVRTSVDAAGNWHLTWNSCGGVQQGCVPSASWSLIPAFCDNLGLSSPPAAISVAGDPTQHSFTATFPGNDGLLGRGLAFQVEGIGEKGIVGAPGSDHTCSYSWRPPDASVMSLTATTPKLGSVGGTATTTVALDLGADPTRAEGGVGAQFTYQLLSGGQVIASQGPTAALSATFAGISAGTQYTAQALVSRPRPPENTVTVGPVPVTAATAPWPTLNLSAAYTQDPGFLSLTGTLTVNVSGLTSAMAKGELFDLVNSSFRCGNASLPLDGSNVSQPLDPADPIVVHNISTIFYYGTCQVTIQLAEDPEHESNPPVFGGPANLSNSATAQVTLGSGSPPVLGAQAGDFAASWDKQGDANALSDVNVSYTGSASQSQLNALTTSWVVNVLAPDGQQCASSTSAMQTAQNGGVNIPVPQTCLEQHGAAPDGGQWTVTIRYQDTAGGATQTMNPPTSVTRTPPTYNNPASCTVSAATVIATWGGTAAKPTVTVATPDASAINGCSGWSMTLHYTPPGGSAVSCGSPPTNVTAWPVTIDVVCTQTPSASGWTVALNYTDTSYQPQSATITVTGTPPQ